MDLNIDPEEVGRACSDFTADTEVLVDKDGRRLLHVPDALLAVAEVRPFLLQTLPYL